MSRNQSAETDITLRELLAVIIRGGGRVLALAVALALVLGLLGLTTAMSADPLEDEEYRLALNSYTMNKEQKEKALARLKKDLESQKDYDQKSLLMQADPYNKQVTTMSFAISGIDIGSANEAFATDETPASYMTQRIQAQYNALFNQLSLTEMTKGTAYETVEEKYLREAITISVEDGGVLLLSIVGRDVDACKKIANTIYKVLDDSESIIERASYPHDFVLLLDTNTKVIVDTQLETLQLESQSKIETGQQEIIKLEQELLQLVKPANPYGVMYVVKRVVLGGFVGAVLAMVWLVCAHLANATVTRSQELAYDYSLTYLGNGASPKGIWKRLAQKSVREHVWKDHDQALAYIRESGISHIPQGSTVAVITSLTKVDEETTAKVMQALGSQTGTIAFGEDAIYNADTLVLIRQCDGVVLAESAFASKVATVEEVLSLVERMKKPVYGYVMV